MWDAQLKFPFNPLTIMHKQTLMDLEKPPDVASHDILEQILFNSEG